MTDLFGDDSDNRLRTGTADDNLYLKLGIFQVEILSSLVS